MGCVLYKHPAVDGQGHWPGHFMRCQNCFLLPLPCGWEFLPRLLGAEWDVPALPFSQYQDFVQEQLLVSLLHPRVTQGSCTKLPFTLEHPENIMGQQLLGRVQAWAWKIHGREPIIVN